MNCIIIVWVFRVQCPVFVLIPMFAASINYFMIGYYPTVDAWLYYIVIGIFTSLVGVSYGEPSVTALGADFEVGHSSPTRLLHFVCLQQH